MDMMQGLAANRSDDEAASGVLTIDLAALRDNYRSLAKRLAPARAAAVVKADAYGLGIQQVAPALYADGCRDFFVAHFGEATRLKPWIGTDARIFVLNGLQPGNEHACADAGIIPVLNSLEQWRRWKTAAVTRRQRLAAILQFDTGMSRLGVPPEDRATLAAELAASDQVDVLYIMSHLASADDADSTQNAEQLAEMQAISGEFPGYDLCFSNSGGLFLGSAYHGKLARPGIALYGGAPTSGQPNPMKPVVRLDIAVIQVRTVKPGTAVGYGAAHVITEEKRLATLAAGYADGLPRSLSDRGAVYYGDVRLPIVGRVSMDSMTVDVTALPQGTLRLGSFVEMIGSHQTLEDVAEAAGTIAYEILTGLGHRYRRDYL